MTSERTFGQWLRAMRSDRGLTLQDLEMQVGVKSATLSRIENEVHQVTISTVIRICNGLDMTPDDLLFALYGKMEPQSSEQFEGAQYTRNVLTPDDVEAFLRFYQRNPEGGLDILISLSAISSQTALLEQDTSRARKEEQEGPSNIAQVTLDPYESEKVYIKTILRAYHPMHKTPDFKYPPSMGKRAVSEINRQGGLIIEADILWYLFHTKLESSSITKSDRRYDNLRTSLEMRSVERCKLADVLWLDESFGAAGQLLKMFWNVGKYKTRIADEMAKEYGKQFANWSEVLVDMLIKITRWLQFLNEDTSWLEELHRKIIISQVL